MTVAAWCLFREHRQLEPLHEGRRDLQPARDCWLRLLAAVVSLCSLAGLPWSGRPAHCFCFSWRFLGQNSHGAAPEAPQRLPASSAWGEAARPLTMSPAEDPILGGTGRRCTCLQAPCTSAPWTCMIHSLGVTTRNFLWGCTQGCPAAGLRAEPCSQHPTAWARAWDFPVAAARAGTLWSRLQQCCPLVCLVCSPSYSPCFTFSFCVGFLF